MKNLINKLKNIDWQMTVLCIIAAPFILLFIFGMVVSTTPDLFDGILWLK